METQWSDSIHKILREKYWTVTSTNARFIMLMSTEQEMTGNPKNHLPLDELVELEDILGASFTGMINGILIFRRS